MDKEKTLPQRKQNRLDNYDYGSGGAYFITICTKDRRCILSHIVGTGVLDCPQIELTPYGEIAHKYIRQLHDFYDHISVENYVIMPNHIHLLLFINNNGQSRTPVPTETDRRNSVLAQWISTFKRFCNKEYGENIWQRSFYDHVIRNGHDYDEIYRYISENPIRWQQDNLYTEE